MTSEPGLVSSTAVDAFKDRQDELPYRRRQQALLRDFGTATLQTRDFRQILQHAVELSARGLGCSYAKVLEYLPDEQRLIVRAGIGWPAGTVDHVTPGADIESPAGFAYQTGQSVISNHLKDETRFRTPNLLAEHGIKGAINVLIRRGGEGDAPFGVLEAESLSRTIRRRRCRFSRRLCRSARNRHRTPTRRCQASGSPRSRGLADARDEPSGQKQPHISRGPAASRPIAEVHDHLWRGSKIGFVDLPDFVSHLCQNLQSSTPEHRLQSRSDPIIISADKAIPLGLLVNELVTKAVKYAYVDGPGVIMVDAREIDSHLRVEISDEGAGLPERFDINQPRKSLGFRVISGLVKQLWASSRSQKTYQGERCSRSDLLSTILHVRVMRAETSLPGVGVDS